MKNLSILRNQGLPVTPAQVMALLFNAKDGYTKDRPMILETKYIGNIFVSASAIASKTPSQQPCVVLTIVLRNDSNSNGTLSDPHYHDSYVVTDLNDVSNLRTYLSKCRINEVATTVPRIAVGLEHIPDVPPMPARKGTEIIDLARDKQVMSDETKAEFDHFMRNKTVDNEL